MVEKNVILDILKKSIHGLLQSSELIDLVETEDSIYTQNLCSSIEALFIHGQIKNQPLTIFSKFGRNKHSYDYDFWNFIKDFIPKSLLTKLENSSLKFTPVGLSRVWLRYALNECTILSYLVSIRSNLKRLQQFYSKDSLIRDQEMMDTFCGLLTSIERIPFNLNTTSSLLNTWVNSDALKIAGIEVVSVVNDNFDRRNLMDCQSSTSNDNKSLSLLSSNDDDAEEEEVLTTNICPPKRYSSSVPQKEFLSIETCSFIGQSINSCQTIDILYGDININDSSPKEDNTDNLYNDHNIEKSDSKVNGLDLEQNDIPQFDTIKTEEISESESTLIDNDILSENIVKRLSNSFDNNKNIKNEIQNEINPIDYSEVPILADDSLESPINTNDIESQEINTDESYDQLWAHQQLETQKSIEKIKVSEIEETVENNNVEESQVENTTASTSDSSLSQPKVYSSLIASKIIAPTTDFVYNLLIRRFNLPIFTVKESNESWEFIGDEILAEKLEMRRLMDIFPGVNICSSDNGLNSVFGGLCSKCAKPLESGKAMVDHYDGKLFCTICESFTKSVIPRNVIYNWDFEPRFVSETTKRFLSEIMSHPNINLSDHPNLFDVIPELARVRQLRHKLNLLWMQVTSCDIETSTKVRETMFPREYMLATLKENDLYSLEDLIILQSGVLEKTLLFVINKVAIPHVKKCLMCRMKAMACDKCRDEKRVIYIHEIDEYCECSTPLCKSVIHKSCKSPTTVSFYCHRCVQYLENQQPITLASYDTANYYD